MYGCISRLQANSTHTRNAHGDRLTGNWMTGQWVGLAQHFCNVSLLLRKWGYAERASSNGRCHGTTYTESPACFSPDSKPLSSPAFKFINHAPSQMIPCVPQLVGPLTLMLGISKKYIIIVLNTCTWLVGAVNFVMRFFTRKALENTTWIKYQCHNFHLTTKAHLCSKGCKWI